MDLGDTVVHVIANPWIFRLYGGYNYGTNELMKHEDDLLAGVLNNNYQFTMKSESSVFSDFTVLVIMGLGDTVMHVIANPWISRLDGGYNYGVSCIFWIN